MGHKDPPLQKHTKKVFWMLENDRITKKHKINKKL